MSKLKTILSRGLWSGLETSWLLAKTIIPVAAVVIVLKHTPVIEATARWLSPLLGRLGLSVEGSVALAMGIVLNLYCAVGALASMRPGESEVFIIAAMLSFCHGLPMELAVVRKVGVSMIAVLAARLGLAVSVGAFLHAVLPPAPSGTSAAMGSAAPAAQSSSASAVLWEVVTTSAGTLFQLAIIVIPLMIVIKLLQDFQLLDRGARLLHPVLRPLGLSERSAVPMLAGLVFGLVYGAGVIIAATRERPLDKREVYLLMIFLGLSHSVAEDALLFVPFGVNAGYLVLLRVAAALIVTTAVAAAWRPRAVERIAPAQAG
jgi:hypothetical protein